MKKIAKVVVALVLIAAFAYGLLFYQNNRDTAQVGKEQIATSYERGVAWLLGHREDILLDGNTMLWWMIGESARISGDTRVQKLFDEFLGNYGRAAPYSVWQAFFHPQQFRNARFSAGEYMSLVEYQQYFLYTLTCSKQLAEEPLIRAQNNPDFCWSTARAFRPTCVTHQLMGYQIAKRNQCAIDQLDKNIAVLQNSIEKQLRNDPRVVDVYVQRVLMLIDTGARQRVKARWLQRVLDAQRPDGGWSPMQPIIPMGAGNYFGFGATGFAVGKPVSNFHATAQGILVMTLLRQ